MSDEARSSGDDYPRLRAVEAFPLEHEGEQLIALRDPAGYTPSVVMLPGGVVEIVALFDGSHSIIDIQAQVADEYTLSLDRVKDLYYQLVRPRKRPLA